MQMTELSEIQKYTLIGKLDKIKEIIKEQPESIQIIDKMGKNLLFYAVLSNNLECVKLLSEFGLDLFHQTKNQSTLLHFTTMHDNIECCKWLIENKSFNIQQTDKIGRTPLHCACFNGSQSIVNYLIEKEYPLSEIPYGQAKNGDTVLHLAARGGHNHILSIFLTSKFSFLPSCLSLLNHPNNLGHTPLHLAFLYGHINTLCYLIQYGGDITISSKNGEIVKSLIEKEKENYKIVFSLIQQKEYEKRIIKSSHLSEDDEMKKEEDNEYLMITSSSVSHPFNTKLQTIPPNTPEEVTKALQLTRFIQAMSDSKKQQIFAMEKSLQNENHQNNHNKTQQFSSGLGGTISTGGTRQFPHSSTLVASSAHKLTLPHISSTQPRLVHSNNNNNNTTKSTNERRYIISDFEDDSSATADQLSEYGDGSRLSSTSEYEIEN